MSAAHASADSIRAALSSPSTCPPTISTILNDLLLPKPSLQTSTTTGAKSKKPVGSAMVAKAKVTKATTTKTRVRKDDEQIHDSGNRLSHKEAYALATEVINITVKYLTDAIKAPVQTSTRRQSSSKDLVKASARKTLRRSNSVPHSPLQPRSLNRIASFPNIRESQSSSSASITNSPHKSMAECARVGFAGLRALQALKLPGIELPPLQLENGMSTLIGKLISLGLDELAVKELRVLKRRLDLDDSKPAKSTIATRSGITLTAPSLASLLDFGTVKATGSKLALIITTQLQVLRLMASARKPKLVEEAITILKLDHPSSPTRLLLLAAKGSESQKQTEKYARQLQTFSEILLSLCPSLSSTEDPIAMESRLSIGPEAAIQLQTFALHCRFLWWGLAKHRGDMTKDIYDPFLRCLSTFARRSQCGTQATYDIVLMVSEDLLFFQSDCAEPQPRPLKSVLGGIYRLLGLLSREAGRIDDAIRWTKDARAVLDVKVDSEARKCAIVARLVGLTLQRDLQHCESEELLYSLLEDLDKPFKGEPSEIEELMTEMATARRSAIALLSQHRSLSEKNARPDSTDGMRQMCESLIFLCPRLAVKYLGNSPDEKASTKDILRHEQRRQFITKLGLHAIDSVLLLIKILMGEDRTSWDLVDSKLQDCILLLDRLCWYAPEPSSDDDTKSSSYYAKISNLYFSHFLNMRLTQHKAQESHQLRAVRRSVDCVRSRPKHERRMAQFTMKLERVAEYFKSVKRYDEVYQTLLVIRDEMAEDGALSVIAHNAESKSLDTIWNETDQARAFGRILESLLQIDLRYLKLADQGRLVEANWTDAEKATVLEYQLAVLCRRRIDSETAKNMESKLVSVLLTLYDRKSYPLRRLRVLSKLLSLGFDHTDEGLKLLGHDLEFMPMENNSIENTQDAGLQRYGCHLKTLTAALLQLRQLRPNADSFSRILCSWTAILRRSESMVALSQEIEDVLGLLTQLQAIAEYLNMKGLDTLALVAFKLSSDFALLCQTIVSPDELVLGQLQVGSQWLHLGYTGKAGLVLDRAASYTSCSGITAYAKIYTKLTFCEYYLTLGHIDKVQENLSTAHELYTSQEASRSNTSCLEQMRMDLLVSQAYTINAALAYERGAAHTALSQAKQGVRMLRRAWAMVEKQEHQVISREPNESQLDVDKLTEEVSQLNVSTISVSLPSRSTSISAICRLWALVPALFKGLNYLSQLFAHNGMSQEMIYYAEQAQKIAEMAESDVHLIVASINLGSAWLKSGSLDKGSGFLMAAQGRRLPNPISQQSALLSQQLGIMHGLLGDHELELKAYDTAEKILKAMATADFINALDQAHDKSEDLKQRMTKLAITKSKPAVARKTTTRAKAVAKPKLTSRAKTPVPALSSVSVECRPVNALLASVLRQKAQALMDQKSDADIETILDESAKYTSTQIDIIHQGLATAKKWLLESLEQMEADPVYSVLQDSTISFPSVLGQTRAEKLGERLSVGKNTPPRTSNLRGVRDRAGAKSPAPGSFSDKLRQAHELLTDIHTTAVHVAPLGLINKTASLLNRVAILLSAVVQAKGRSSTSPGIASSSIETARTLAFQRERKATLVDPYQMMKSNDVCWPQASGREPRRSSIGSLNDTNRFQRDYVDIIPKSWTVISISLGDNRQELCVSKLQSGHNPFIIRLPLGRHNSMDADEEVFGFEEGHTELMEILELANESSHDATNRKSREEKSAWWEEREALDVRLKDLLENVEKVWLGGFTGIFSQHVRRSELLARFQKSFSNIIDRHLPSRRSKYGSRNTNRIALDTRILDLFIGLGDATDEECDLSEPLNDLLYFVVDVLQFHGEFNAYAEIDFDSMVVEAHDALRSYHAAVHAAGDVDHNRHTILVLDKALHSFPWESLPCMYGLAVSRVSSLGCLRDRVVTQQSPSLADEPEGHYISRNKGSYILNPEGDLKNTQTTFKKSFEKLEGWEGMTNCRPTEEEFRDQLASKNMLVYFGHGSGAQYIRAKEIKKLETCAVTILMGCSSGALKEAGEFEPYGPPVNYMHAGCPALVATLWDVTDKDIDRFAKSTFEHWGLLEPEPQGKGKSRKKAEEVRPNISLAEAVAKGRAACNLKYLNGASVCIYGVPVYLE